MAVFSDLKGINCHSCPTAYKKQRGCLSDVPEYRIGGIGIDEQVLTRCPRWYVGGTELILIGAFREYRNGHLPNAGGWLDQPIKYSAAMEVIESAFSKISEKIDGDK